MSYVGPFFGVSGNGWIVSNPCDILSKGANVAFEELQEWDVLEYRAERLGLGHCGLGRFVEVRYPQHILLIMHRCQPLVVNICSWDELVRLIRIGLAILIAFKGTLPSSPSLKWPCLRVKRRRGKVSDTAFFFSTRLHAVVVLEILWKMASATSWQSLFQIWGRL